MAGYGAHPTQYGSLTNGDLYSMYCASIFSNLTESQKLDLLQETVNRDAEERGELGAPQVVFSSLPADTSGTAADGVIKINREMVVEQQQSFVYKGQAITHPMTTANLECLNTIFHENTHCWQDQIVDGTIQCQQKGLVLEYSANAFTVSPVLVDGKYTLGCQYMTGVTPTGYYCYYFQATERDAYLAAELKTEQIIQSLSEKYGMEQSFADYRKSVSLTGYQAMEKEAVQIFQNPHFVKDLNQALMNQFYGTNVPVNPATEQAVKREMAATYQNILGVSIKSSQWEGKNMSLNGKVTLAEYNDSLRSGVNAYYTHAINDPNISREEALTATGQVAENYLNAIGEFQAEQGIGAAGEPNGGIAENVEEGTVFGNGPSLTEAMDIEAMDEVDNDGSVDGNEINGDGIDGDGIEGDDIDSDGIDGEGCDDGMDL